MICVQIKAILVGLHNIDARAIRFTCELILGAILSKLDQIEAGDTSTIDATQICVV